MSSLTYENGKRKGYRLRFYTAIGRRSIWLGRVGDAEAKATQVHVDQILSAQTADLPLSRKTQQWIDRTSPELRVKIAPIMGLFKTVKTAVDEFLDQKSRAIEQSTLATLENSLGSLADALRSCLVQSVDRVALDAIRDGLCVADSTKAKFWKHWRQFFNWCIEKHYTAENPAKGFSAIVGASKKPFIDGDMIRRLIDACKDHDLRAVIALSRWGGIRIPSELYPIRSDDVGDERIRIVDSKRHCVREIPIFDELRPHLEAIKDFGISHLLTLSPSGISSRFEGLIESHKIIPWPSLWHSMRASRETELIREYGITTACLWIGNSPAVAAKHYAQVLPADWARAIAKKN